MLDCWWGMLLFSMGTLFLPLTYQSSLLKMMKPLLPRPKATWLLPLSHQLEKGSPSTTLRKITMFLKTQAMSVTAPATALKPHAAGSKRHCFYFLLLPAQCPTWSGASDAHKPSRCHRSCPRWWWQALWSHPRYLGVQPSHWHPVIKETAL